MVGCGMRGEWEWKRVSSSGKQKTCDKKANDSQFSSIAGSMKQLDSHADSSFVFIEVDETYCSWCDVAALRTSRFPWCLSGCPLIGSTSPRSSHTTDAHAHVAPTCRRLSESKATTPQSSRCTPVNGSSALLHAAARPSHSNGILARRIRLAHHGGHELRGSVRMWIVSERTRAKPRLE